MPPDPHRLLLISVGNSRTRIASATQGQLDPSRVLDNAGDLDGALDEIVQRERSRPGAPTVLLSSVNEPVASRIADALTAAGLGPVQRFGPDLPIPIQDALQDRSTVGQDRLFNALGAFWRTRQACIVIDAGTAVTVDFVDGEGTFQGGVIAPGVGLMLRALHEHTAALPLADAVQDRPGPDAPPFGKTTRQAIALGVVAAAQGLARILIDRYAEFYEAYPLVVATGGDAPLLFDDDPLIERVVPDLPLVGMLAAYERLETMLAEDEGGDG